MYDELLAFLEEYAPLTNFTEPLLVPIPLSKRRERKRGFNQCELLCEEIRRLDSPFPTRLAEASGVAREGSTAVFGRRDFSPFTKWSSNNARGENFTYSPSVLRKVKDTPSQTKSRNKKERMKNLAGCFEASIEVSGRNVILIDDVATTGATLLEARRALRKSGARKVIAFTIAH
ncbi:MAG: hypothetical protein COV91_05240 [Candidatus Taylorbacteria bacterium CG11_big_fil_rev_8_21_14_0_20_46_11]|uniref:Phosphoribosyltransferase domain-containing protein n=1 Tax=Candidatus Taylorbacteria bacterium CG11_big_fil_rev_8_21_14_0_20_46_11 TaxID=1975025 RepID=A0A2H0KAI0_9BACT|nr:MAG: hypothetical protein COV91_05240 [Candidatus Taylorbacteria bacterium CG11_big_fil_rev_8_21_14_0_20_46_11]